MSEVSASLERNPYAKTAWVIVRNTHGENRLQVVLELDGVEDVLEDTWVPCLDISEGVHLYSHQVTNLFNGRDEEISSLKAQLKREMVCTDFYANREVWVELGGMACILNDMSITDNYGGYSGGKLARETVKARE